MDDRSNGFCLELDFGISGSEKPLPASSDSSSIGQPDDDSDEDEEEVHSSLSLGSLDDSLPFKKGLSNYYAGRSKSFSNLAEVKDTKELGKAESPFSKRRRNIVSHKWTFCKRMKNKTSFYAHGNPISMPLLPVDEDNDDGEYEQEHEHQESRSKRLPNFSPIKQCHSDLDFQEEYSYRCDAYHEHPQQQDKAPPDHDEEEKVGVAVHKNATNHVTIDASPTHHSTG